MDMMLVRLKPHEPKRGYVLKRFAYRGITFHSERGWYRVEKDIAEYLRGVHEEPTDPTSPLAFEVYTEREAKDLEEKEEVEAREKKRTVEAPTVSARPSDEEPQKASGRGQGQKPPSGTNAKKEAVTS